MQSLTPEFFDVLVIAVIVIGLALAAVRLYADLSRPLPQRPTRDTYDRERTEENS
jgi:hypothetical protein